MTSHSPENLRSSLDALVESAPDAQRAEMAQEMDTFHGLYSRFLAEAGNKLEWDAIQPPAEGLVIPFEELAGQAQADPAELLSKLAVLKLNGGLGTTMGCVGPKSAIEVREGSTFLDLTVQQIQHLNNTYGVDVPLVLMNSFNTHTDTLDIVGKYADMDDVTVLTFNQSRMPRLFADSHEPVPSSAEDADTTHWYPPGHGDVYASLVRSGMLAKLREMGKEVLFLSNVDNLGANVGTALPILEKIVKDDTEYIMEVTDKTMADVKGGTIITYEGVAKLLEIAQVPEDKVPEFKNVTKFKIFNTNSMWVSLEAIDRLVGEGALNMDIIENKKKLADGTPVIQLEQACGAVMEYFNGAIGVNVPRSRFLPVKKTSDLALVQSNLFDLADGSLSLSAARVGGLPPIKFGAEFSKMPEYTRRIPGSPDLLGLNHLILSGDIVLGSGLSFAGSVAIIAPEGETLVIPDGMSFNNQVVTSANGELVVRNV